MPSTRVLVIAAALGAAAACVDSPTVSPPPTHVDCSGTQTPVVTLGIYAAVTVRGDALRCLALAGRGASYIVTTQLLGRELPYGGYGYRFGEPDATAAVRHDPDPSRAPHDASFLRVTPPPSAQQRLDGWMRAREREPLEDALRPLRSMRSSTSVAVADPPLRTFSVLSSLTTPPIFAQVGARLRFDGTRVAVYVDTLAESAFSDAELASLGAVLDEVLMGAALEAFGQPTDVDGNGRVILLLTPVVNALVTAAECGTNGYVRGFFHAHDLSSAEATSNRAELFYAFVADAAGRWSCAHTREEVTENIPPTFIHELQHMISYGQHAVMRAGSAEEPWLNEGLSHVAEELGSLQYENRYPAPSGRTRPTQLFPDSAAAFITPNLLYAHRYLFLSNAYSALGCAPGTFCALPERAASWLFLRWLGDHKGAVLYRRLVETSLTGASNLESAAGESLSSLFGDFTLALWGDSIPGVPRASVAPRHRFLSRNFRELYQALYDAYGPLGGVGSPFPIAPVRIEPGAAFTSTMRPGTFVMHEVTAPDAADAIRLTFTLTDGVPFPSSAGAQLSILRVR